MDIQKHIKDIRETIPTQVQLICVSKFHPAELIQEAYDAGERCFAESRPQELVEKVDKLPKDIQWHFIGNLQTNKVKMVVPNATLIHSVSNERLFDEIEKCASKIDKVQDVLIELHVAQEESKQGFSPSEAEELVTKEFVEKHQHIRICGVMGMATFTDDEMTVRNDFRRIVDTFNVLKASVFNDIDTFKEISIGMSEDYKIAIAEGATMVRIGSSIFGARKY